LQVGIFFSPKLKENHIIQKQEGVSGHLTLHNNNNQNNHNNIKKKKGKEAE
jgi:hypothetical protein